MPYVLPHPIETQRLIIREVEARDMDALFAIHNNPEVTRYIPHMHWPTREQADVWFARLLDRREKKSAVQCAVIRRAASDEPYAVIGTLVLFNFEEASALAEIGWLLGAQFWHRGYMQEAMLAFIDCAFNVLDLRRLEAAVDSRNLASNTLAERMGFVREGVLRERWIGAGELQDVHLFGLLRRDWDATRGTVSLPTLCA